MKLSMVIPTYILNDDLERLAFCTAISYKDQVDELIITEDGGRHCEKLRGIADIYIYNKKNRGFSVNVNTGWKMASGDFVAIVNSDTSLSKGNIRDLCIEGKVTSPEIENQFIPFLAGPFFVVPKSVTKERGMLIEDMRTYFSDSDYDHRVRDIFQKVDSVVIYHEMAKTVTAAGIEGQMEKDRKTYARLVKEGKAKS